MKENKDASSNKIKSYSVENKDKISRHTQKVGFFKFLFGIDVGYTKFLLILGVFFILIYILIQVLTEILFGLCLNFINSGNMSDLKFLCFIIIFVGLFHCSLMLSEGFLLRKHSQTLNEKYKKNYYSLVLKQDYLWFNKQDLNKFSESIKKDISNIEKWVKFIFYKCLLPQME